MQYSPTPELLALYNLPVLSISKAWKISPMISFRLSLVRACWVASRNQYSLRGCYIYLRLNEMSD